MRALRSTYSRSMVRMGGNLTAVRRGGARSVVAALYLVTDHALGTACETRSGMPVYRQVNGQGLLTLERYVTSSYAMFFMEPRMHPLIIVGRMVAGKGYNLWTHEKKES